MFDGWTSKEEGNDELEDSGIDVKEPGDEEYQPPHANGCWICNGGPHSQEGNMSFSIEYDAYYHVKCLEKTGFDTLAEYEANRGGD